MADVFTFTALISGVSIEIVMEAQYAGTREVVATEARPASFQEAETFLAVHGFRKVRNWDLGELGMVSARVGQVDNKFGGTRAARLWDAVGTTHGEWETAQARTVEDGDLISDLEVSEPYVVAGSRFEMDTMRVHMVRDGGVWAERYTTDFPASQLVKVARRKA